MRCDVNFGHLILGGKKSKELSTTHANKADEAIEKDIVIPAKITATSVAAAVAAAAKQKCKKMGNKEAIPKASDEYTNTSK